jgi:U6 snRNA-associated Sm-like protein LSm6
MYKGHLLTRGNTGELQSVDGYMNIALEQTNEIVDGKVRRNYGDAFVRGNNGMCFCSSLSPEERGDTDVCVAAVMYISADS